MTSRSLERTRFAEIKCLECGTPLKEGEEGWRWARCEICNAPVCMDHTYYIRARREGLYDHYYYALRVCKNHRV